MPTPVNKLIVTNFTALEAKYGATGLAVIKNAVNELVSADESRGLKTLLVPVDEEETMDELNVRAVADPENPRQNKNALDGLYQKLDQPDYVVILGAPDVIPHQNPVNPVHPAQDPDLIAFGDLPYACEHPFSSDLRDFLKPTRVVGRLPDITGGDDVQYLQQLLRIAANYQSRPANAYASFLGISAAKWQLSTEQSLRAVFGNIGGLRVSPNQGPDWSASELGTLAHFINCHGADAMDEFYGELDGEFPLAHKANKLTPISEGTVISAECCYGAQLYDPRDTGNPLSICNTCLQKGAYGFFGSSTIAFGPSAGNANADLICQFFLKNVLAGKSLGHATLLARQEFIVAAEASGGLLDPFELKTLGQFSLMGDPAIHPVQAPPTDHTVVHLGAPGDILTAAEDVDGRLRRFRRGMLRGMGSAVGNAARAVLSDRKPVRRKAIKTMLTEAITRAGMTDADAASFSTFDVEDPATGAKAPLAEHGPAAVHIAFAQLPAANDEPFPRFVAVVGREMEEDVILNTLYSR